MYDIRQFRPTLFALLMLGFTGFAVAAQTPGVWLIAMSATLLNVWLFNRGSFRPLPRFMANAITLVFAAFLVLRVKSMPGPPILAIGEFLIFLQLIKLYEQRGNRDLAQLLILSLLLMVAAAISTGSLIFGLLFVVYLFLSLYCCLLFHLKTETDHAKAVTGIDESRLNPMTLRQDQRFLTRSMRRLTGTVSFAAITMALLVFLFFPRGTGAGVIGNLAFRPSQAMTGFSDQVSFQDVARISQNEAIVAYVTIQKNGQSWGGLTEQIYLRGTALDTYVSDASDSAERWKWKRTTQGQTDIIPSIGAGEDKPLNDPVAGSDLYQQRIRLLPTGTNTIFALPGAVSIRPEREVRLSRGLADDVLQLQEALTGEFTYNITSSNLPYTQPTTRSAQVPYGQFVIDLARPRRSDDVPKTYPVPQEIRDFAMKDEVAGSDSRGNYAAQRVRLGNRPTTDVDEPLARNIEQYLQKNFSYTLDLTDARRVSEKDPMVEFLYDFKKGHCEYFAGAMALMCQSLGMQARVVTGFKCDDFNSVGGYYTVKQSHAHAWVEVLTNKGWQMFDPTAAGDANGRSRGPGVWRQMMNFFNYLEYTWGNSVVNYDAESRTNIIQNVDSGLTTTAYKTNAYLEAVKSFFLNLQNFYFVSSGLLSFLMATLICVIIGAVIFFLLERIRLRRRARRIGLNSLPNEEQRRLARQLLFYDELVKTLDRRKIERGPHLTPMEFSQSVGYLPAEVYRAIQRLTRVFYRVRYGAHELQGPQQRRLLRAVERIEQILGPAKP